MIGRSVLCDVISADNAPLPWHLLLQLYCSRSP